MDHTEAIYRFKAIAIKMPMEFCTELEQIIFKFVWKYKRSWTVKTMLRKSTELEESHSLTLEYTTKLY